ncbi:IstB domain protein ATP-binding protein [Actinobacteria bacterium OK074]|nr:IstB domain protein ATP-binding protein [Actinobacteria bacterium OK074]
MTERYRLDEPQRVGLHPSVARLTARFAARGIDPATPIADTPEPIPALEAAQERIPPRFRHAVADHPGVAAWCRTVGRQASAPSAGARRQVTTGPSLLLLGPTGTGKTRQAYGAIRSLLGAGIGVHWNAVTAADLYAEMRPRPGLDPEWMLRHLLRTPLLVLDDLGAARMTEWTDELTYRLVNHRYNHELPTVMTSNLPVASLRSKLGDRIASRIAGMAEQITLDGPDRRRDRPA